MLREFVEWQVARPAPPVLIERAVDDHGLIVAPDRALQAVFLVPGLGFIAVLIVRVTTTRSAAAFEAMADSSAGRRRRLKRTTGKPAHSTLSSPATATGG